MVTVSNALLMPSVTVIVRSGGLFWLKPVAIVLFMLCSAVAFKGSHVAWRCVGCCLLCTGLVSSPVFLLSMREVISV